MRPRGITALGVFFAAGCLIALTSAASLLFPESFLEPRWRLNVALGTEPRAIVGIPIVALLLFYLSRPGVRGYFEQQGNPC
jgi:hypothetical protein